MKFVPTLTISLIVALGVQATPRPEADANPPRTLAKRDDNLCRVIRRTDCRSKAGTKTGHHVRYVEPGVVIGVSCTVATKEEGIWDLIPGFGCLVSYHDTVSADTAHEHCEVCPTTKIYGLGNEKVKRERQCRFQSPGVCFWKTERGGWRSGQGPRPTL
ncbi:hypothetical protein DM02DRAFT_632306 [Periconia macrospinosa]|uniref:Uncharacterized protein n=1 Tax=Periconia macrospinosa TaxID=97972 RepID=A0A2V1DD85_9PLEO|nr:hypothetical protein DM02DRAFT_632306 [Periconia macrospinosa]